jgi:hypothetical protein
MKMSGHRKAPAAFSPEKEPHGTHWIGDRVGPTGGLDTVLTVGMICDSSGNQIPVASPQASKAVPANVV